MQRVCFHYYIIITYYHIIITLGIIMTVCVWVWEKNAKMLGIIYTVTVLCLLWPLLTATLCHQSTYLMNNFFLPTPRLFLSFFRTYCPFWVQVAQMVFHFTHFQNSGQEKGCFGVWIGVLCVQTYPCRFPERCVILGKMRPHLGKMRPIWAIRKKSGQTCSRIGFRKFSHVYV